MAVEESKDKTSPDRGWSPGLLRMTPVDAFQQVTELCGRDRHRAVGGRRPQKASSLEALGEQARALAIMPDDLQQIAPAATKDKQMATHRGAAPPGPAARGRESPCACRCARSPATPARRLAPGSSRLIQNAHDPPQRDLVEVPAHQNAPAVRTQDLKAV